MASFTQENRQLVLSTPLGEDVLLLTSFSGQEELSRLFRFRLEVLSEQDHIASKDLVGKNITWCVQRVDQEPRYFNGFVSRFAAGGLHQQGLRSYWLEAVPWLWFLTRSSNCRIFQQNKTPDILETIFKEFGFTDFKFALTRSYPTWDYCVQYRETAFNFVSRLMEHEGMFYTFQHENGKHTLVVADNKGAYKDCVENQVDYWEGSLAPNHLGTWEHQYAFRSGNWTHTDYNFETPSTNLLTHTKTLIELPGVQKYEFFDYPGEYRVRGDGEADVRIRMEEEEVPYEVATGSSQCCTFTPGGKFTLKAHPVAAEAGQTYVLTTVQHAATDTSWENSNGTETYHNTFACIPAAVVFRPERSTPKPVVQGVQTAVVVGPKGETIFCDKYGRVKVQFFWDRLGKKDEKSSCWVRVSQNWGGGSWGGMFVPHMGQEVIVAFEEGDPDRPQIVGRNYNAEQMPPLALPANKTQSLLRDHGGNQIVMEGMGAQQQIMLHSPHSNTTLSIGSPSPSVHRFKGSGRGGGSPDDNQWLAKNRLAPLDTYWKTNADSNNANGPGGHFVGGFHFYSEESWYAHIGTDELVQIDNASYRWVLGESHTTIDNAHTLNILSTSDIVVKGKATETYHNTYDLVVDGKATETFHKDLTTTLDKGTWTVSIANEWNNTVKNNVLIQSTAGSITIHAAVDVNVIADANHSIWTWGSKTDFCFGIHYDTHIGFHLDTHVGAHVDSHALVHLDTHAGAHIDTHIGPHIEIHTILHKDWGPTELKDFAIATYKGAAFCANFVVTKIGNALKVLGL